MKKMTLVTLALVLPALFLVSVACAEPPEETPAGTQPATPGGGNPGSNSENAATPANPVMPGQGVAPQAAEPGPDNMDAREAGNLGEGDAGFTADAKAKWDAMTPDEKKQFMKDHPNLRRAMFRKKWDSMTQDERGAFLDAHPEMKDKLKARWAAMTPEERQAFLAKHPKIALRWKKERGERMENQGERREERGERVEKRGEKMQDNGREKAGERVEKRGERMQKQGERREKRGERVQKKALKD